jgi:ATP-binding protein involved in chromosome partitioning
MEQDESVDLLRINGEFGCRSSFRCSDCHRFFNCDVPHKKDFWENTRFKQAAENLKGVKRFIAVMSGKGGVGKSIISANLAVALASKGYAVAILDSDIYGPSIPNILGVEGEDLKWGPKGIVPWQGRLGIKIVSMGFLLGEDSVVTWLNEDKRKAQELFLANTDYGNLDYLIIDMPPGTGSETVNLLKYLPQLSGALIVTVPTDVAERVVHRCISLCQRAKVRILGIIENMSSVKCPECGETYALQHSPGDALAAEAGVPLLGKISRDPDIVNAADAGVSFLLQYPNSPAAKNFLSIIDKLEAAMGSQPDPKAPAQPDDGRSELPGLVDINANSNICNFRCWACQRYFVCTYPQKEDLSHRQVYDHAGESLAQVKHVIAVMSCKGGVGKSTFTANLAAALALKGKKVTILDLDFHGPCIPKMLGMDARVLKVSRKGIKPATGLLGIGVVSVDYVVDRDEPVTWFDDLKKMTVEQLINWVDYGNLDYLIVDLPPGTGSESCGLLQLLPNLDGTIIMTLPSVNPQNVARRSINLCRQAGIKVAGIVENMSSFVCPHCQGVYKMSGNNSATKLASQFGVPYLGEVPLDINIAASCDEGIPFLVRHPDSMAAKCFNDIAGKLEEFFEK